MSIENISDYPVIKHLNTIKPHFTNIFLKLSLATTLT